jgi:hypothetical protein
VPDRPRHLAGYLWADIFGCGVTALLCCAFCVRYHRASDRDSLVGIGKPGTFGRGPVSLFAGEFMTLGLASTLL